MNDNFTPLPADLPENWTPGQIVSPDGLEVGLTKQHGYNYLNKAVNDAQQGVNQLYRHINYTISETPNQVGVLTYNEKEQSPHWSGYDPNKMDISGKASGVNAGIYMAEFTPKDGYTWSNGGVEARSESWTIEKAPGRLSLNKYNMNINLDEVSTGEIVVTVEGNGMISVRSSDLSVATFSINGNIVKVSGHKSGVATIAVKAAEGDNYTQTAEEICTVTVSSARDESTLNGIGAIRLSPIDLEEASGGKWIACDGRILSSTSLTYRSLFNKIKNTYGYSFRKQDYPVSGTTYFILQACASSRPTTNTIACCIVDNTNNSGKLRVSTGMGSWKVSSSNYYVYSLFFVDADLYMIGSSSGSGTSILYRVSYTGSSLTFTSVLSGVWGSNVYGFYKNGNTLYIVTYGDNGQSGTSDYMGIEVIKLNLDTKQATRTVLSEGQYTHPEPIVVGKTVYYTNKSGSSFAYDLVTEQKVSKSPSTWPVPEGSSLIGAAYDFSYSVLFNEGTTLQNIYLVNNLTSSVSIYPVYLLSEGNLILPPSSNRFIPIATVSPSGDLRVYIRHEITGYSSNPVYTGILTESGNNLIFPEIKRGDRDNADKNPFLSSQPYTIPYHTSIMMDHTKGLLSLKRDSSNAQSNVQVTLVSVDTSKFRVPLAGNSYLYMDAVGNSPIFPYTLHNAVYIKAKE